MNTLYWRVEVLSPPPVLRYCKKCGAEMPFVSSGLFRVNAQKKHVDVWLIYRCSLCNTSWNHALVRRANPHSIEQQKFEKYLANDTDLAFRSATDCDALKRDGAVVGLTPFSVVGREIDWERECRIEVACECPANIKLAAVLCEKTKLSRSHLKRLIEAGCVKLQDGGDAASALLRSHQVVTVLPLME